MGNEILVCPLCRGVAEDIIRHSTRPNVDATSSDTETVDIITDETIAAAVWLPQTNTHDMVRFASK